MREAEAERLVAAVEGELAAYGLTVADVLAAVGRARASGIGVSAERVNPEISGIGTVLPNPGGEPFTIVAVGSVTSRIMGPRFAGLCDILREEVARFADSGALVPV
jgi:DNA-binding IclR family transcriptional regulator